MTEATENKHAESNGQIQRLIDWNADVLLKLLKRIVTKREALGKAGWDDEPELETKDTVLDEVVEVINLPPSDGRLGNSSIDVDPQVEQQLKEYVAAVCSAYHSNPFHCLQHASHATMAVTKLLSRIAVNDSNGTDGSDLYGGLGAFAAHLHSHTYGLTSDPLTQFSIVLAALIHGVDHRGLSNEGIAKEEPDVVVQYKGKSITEQRSLTKAWNKLMELDFENLRRCIYADKAEKQLFRQVLVNSVLATNIDDEELQSQRMSRWESTFGPNLSLSDEDTNRKATVVIECLIQASGIFHTMQHWHVYLKWTERAFEEANDAFKAGRLKENPAEVGYRNELKFFDNFVIPLTMQLKDIDAFVVCSDEYLNYALKNRQRWAASGRDIISAFNAKYNGPKEGAAFAKLDLARALVDDDLQKSSKLANVELPRHLQRLVDWNVEVFQRLLKQILAKRYATGQSTPTDVPIFKVEEGKSVIDEIPEVITFASFDPKALPDKLDANSVYLSLAVSSQLRDYVTMIATKFRDHPFHCLEHGSQVSMTANKLLSRIVAPASSSLGANTAADLHEKTFGLVSDPLAQFAVVFAGLIHDVDHEGVPNNQLVREDHALAQKYKNRSITEQNSIDEAWSLLMEPGFEDLRSCIYTGTTELQRFRKIVVKCVMATNSVDEKLLAIREARWNKAFGEGESNDTQEDVDRKATSVLVTLMQAADSFHAIGHWHMYQKWNERQFLELYGAYEAGRLEEDPTNYWYESELKHLESYIMPLCQKMSATGVFGASTDECTAFANINRDQWAANGVELVVAIKHRHHGTTEQKARDDKIFQRQSLS